MRDGDYAQLGGIEWGKHRRFGSGWAGSGRKKSQDFAWLGGSKSKQGYVNYVVELVLYSKHLGKNHGSSLKTLKLRVIGIGDVTRCHMMS